VRDMNEAVKAVFDFDEGAEFGDVAHLAGDDGADGILFSNEEPGIRLRLLDAERDAAFLGIDVEDHNVDFFTDLGDFRRVDSFFGPAQFADVDQAFNALLELDKDTVVDHAHDFALVFAAREIFFRSVNPRIGNQLLEAKRDALLFLIELE